MIKRITGGIKWLLIQPPLHFIVLIVLMAYLTSRLPNEWAVGVRIFNGFAILGILIWGFFRFGQETRLYRAELKRHREEIIEMMRHRDATRDATLKTLNDNALTLARETTKVAAVLAEETRANFDHVSKQVVESTIAAKRAFEEANAVNTKIEELNQRLLEQGQEHAGESKILADLADTAKETNVIIKDNVVPAVAEGGQLDKIQKIGEESHEILRKTLNGEK
jgi:hypothetical protein